MIIAKCPLRISLFGGSTDNPSFIEQYGYGSVISFSCDLKTYVTLHEDKIGYNKHLHKHIINYSIREEVDTLDEIKNEVVQVVLKHFETTPMTISLTSDAYSQGSGLASSSAYIVALIKAIAIKQKTILSDEDVCHLAYVLERKINPFCGLQDAYGCGIGGFKRIEFHQNEKVNFSFLPTKLFGLYDFYLLFTGISRNSKNILQDLSFNVNKIKDLLPIVETAETAILNEEYSKFIELINESWKVKKTTSNLILDNDKLKQLDDELINDPSILAHKLCGAGNGGFFLIVTEKNEIMDKKYIKINVCQSGIIGVKL